MDKKYIYLDNAATTRTYESVVDEMKPYMSELYGNASSIYSLGQSSKEAITTSREIIAKAINTNPEEIYFTAGGSEADNWILIETARAYKDKGKHIITSQIEHHAILHTCEYLEKECGCEITYLPVDENGLVNPKDLEKAIRKDTILVSIMLANNEIGTIEPIQELSRIAHENNVLFHTDAVQAINHIPVDVNNLGIDMLSSSGHKFHGPKGVGFAYIRKGIKIKSYIHGGAQERKRRAGTENVPGIVGMAKATSICQSNMKDNMEYQIKLRNHMIDRISNEIPYCRLNGDKNNRLPNNVNFSFEFIEGESLLIMLDSYGICASSGSACTSGSLDPSHVLLAIGLKHEIAHGSLRLTISEETTMEEIDFTVDKLIEIVNKLRQMSPLYEDFISKNK